jgi:type III pantothenate kinase
MPAEFLLIDISNSFTKLIPSNRDALVGEVLRIPTPRLTATALRRAAGPPTAYKGIILSSVVPSAVAAVEEYASRSRRKDAPPRLLKISHQAKLGIGIDYPKPASIGADRLANAAGAAVFYGTPTVVVDFGTAVTFDVLGGSKKSPAYLGGVIAPGLEAMTHYLHQRTALLPQIDLREPESAIGKSTLDAMLAGAIFGYRGLVRQILEELRRELKAGKKLQVVATGGYAELIAKRLPEIGHLHPNLTLEGLRVIAGLNF